jgi:hypothetical protein
VGVVEDFVARYGAHDWDGLATCFSIRRFRRVGPYCDVIDSSEAYLQFLRRVVPTLSDEYELRTVSVAYSGSTAVAELVEHLEVDGVMKDIPEAIIFGLDEDGLIEGMRLYLQQPDGLAPVGGRDAMGQRPT